VRVEQEHDREANKETDAAYRLPRDAFGRFQLGELLHSGLNVGDCCCCCSSSSFALIQEGRREGVGKGTAEQSVDVGNQQIRNTKPVVLIVESCKNGARNGNIGHHGSRQRLLDGRGVGVTDEHFTDWYKYVLANNGHVNGLWRYHEALIGERWNKALAAVIRLVEVERRAVLGAQGRHHCGRSYGRHGRLGGVVAAHGVELSEAVANQDLHEKSASTEAATVADNLELRPVETTAQDTDRPG